MKYYYIECDICGSQSQVSCETDDYPTFCSMCGERAETELIGEDEDSDE